MAKRRNTELWDNFYKCMGSDKTAICKYCKKTLSFRGTSTNLKTHLKLKHFNVYESLSLATERQNVLENSSDFAIQETTAERSKADPLQPVFISVSQRNQQDSHSKLNNESHRTTPSMPSTSDQTIKPEEDSVLDTQNERRNIDQNNRAHDDNNDAILNALQRLENISSAVNSTQQTLHTQDEFHFFALSVAAQLRSLPLRIAVETQSKIQSTLSAARLSSILLNSQSSPSSYNNSSSNQHTNSTDTPDTNKTHNMPFEIDSESIKHESDTDNS